jgi:hypothetical protein
MFNRSMGRCCHHEIVFVFADTIVCMTIICGCSFCSHTNMHSGRYSHFTPDLVSSRICVFADISNMRDSKIYESLLTGEHDEVLCLTEEEPLLMVNLFPQY